MVENWVSGLSFVEALKRIIFMNQPSPYQSFLAERDEILRHKWIESEKAGHDIGFEAALFDWVTNCRALWKEKQA